MSQTATAPLRLLLLEGNTRAHNARLAADGVITNAEAYEAAVRLFEPEAAVDRLEAGEADAGLPAGVSIGDYDGVIIGGAALHVRVSGNAPEVARQIDLARAVFEAGPPFLGSCWGLQVAAVAAGGAVEACAAGREVPVAEGIQLTDAGQTAPLLAGRRSGFRAPAIHLDEVVRLPSGSDVLATNGHSRVQAARISSGRCTFWGVQFHPEFTPAYVAGIMRRLGEALVTEGRYGSRDALDRDVADLEAGDGPAARDPDLGDERVCATEIGNWLALCRGIAGKGPGSNS